MRCAPLVSPRLTGLAVSRNEDDDFTDEEAASRAIEAIRRAFQATHIPLKAMKGTTPRAKAMAAKRKRPEI